jgi:adenosine deaminase
MNYTNLPKIDLHCHLDGSVRPESVLEIALKQDVTLPTTDIQALTSLMIAPDSCKDLLEYLTRFDLPLSVMQTEYGIERITYELFEDAAKENVKYFEVRFGPLLHLNNGLNLDQVIGSAVKGMQRAESDYEIKGNLILSVLRHMPKESINSVIEAGDKYLNKGVIAFDIAGGEPDGFCHGFEAYTQYAADKGYRITIHAGEQGSGQNVYDAISLLGAERIGHGIGIQSHAEAYQLVKTKNAALETCPTSNVQTKAVETLSEHPFEVFYQDNVPVTINTDNRTVSNTTMTDEVRRVIETFNLSEDDYYSIYQSSIEQSFASVKTKEWLKSFVKP